MAPGPLAGRHYPRSTGEFLAWFQTDADCLDYLEWLRWPEGFVCAACGSAGGWRLGDGRFGCAGCKSRTSPTAGTIFDRTRTPLTVWFTACWLFATQKDGVSALSLPSGQTDRFAFPRLHGCHARFHARFRGCHPLAGKVAGNPRKVSLVEGSRGTRTEPRGWDAERWSRCRGRRLKGRVCESSPANWVMAIRVRVRPVVSRRWGQPRWSTSDRSSSRQ
jgi:hypothetical protein